jgi:hypothetical protein
MFSRIAGGGAAQHTGRRGNIQKLMDRSAVDRRARIKELGGGPGPMPVPVVDPRLQKRNQVERQRRDDRDRDRAAARGQSPEAQREETRRAQKQQKRHSFERGTFAPVKPRSRFQTMGADHPEFATTSGVTAQQPRFDALVQRAVLESVEPTVDAVRTHELFYALKAVDPTFAPQQYGVPEFQLLVRHCKYLETWRGKLAFCRLFDPDHEDVTIALEAYEFNQPRSKDAMRAPPNPHVNFKGVKWT